MTGLIFYTTFRDNLRGFDVFADQKQAAFFNSYKAVSTLTMCLLEVLQTLEETKIDLEVKKYFLQFLQVRFLYYNLSVVREVIKCFMLVLGIFDLCLSCLTVSPISHTITDTGSKFNIKVYLLLHKTIAPNPNSTISCYSIHYSLKVIQLNFDSILDLLSHCSTITFYYLMIYSSIVTS